LPGGKACESTRDTAKCATEACPARTTPLQQKGEKDAFNNWWLEDREDNKPWPKYARHLKHKKCCIACSTGKPCGNACVDQGALCDENEESDSWCACHNDVHQAIEKQAQARAQARAATTLCTPGMYEVQHLPNLCKECAPGRYQSQSNKQSCQTCPDWQEPNKNGGATACVNTTAVAPVQPSRDCIWASFPFKIDNTTGSKIWLWTRCSKKCGPGYQSRERSFTAPSGAGAACTAESHEYASCEIKPCTDAAEAASADQSETEGVEYQEYLRSKEAQTVRMNGEVELRSHTLAAASP
jgi:hypothetical protein